jgi:hypothetical protein
MARTTAFVIQHFFIIEAFPVIPTSPLNVAATTYKSKNRPHGPLMENVQRVFNTEQWTV